MLFVNFITIARHNGIYELLRDMNKRKSIARLHARVDVLWRKRGLMEEAAADCA